MRPEVISVQNGERFVPTWAFAQSTAWPRPERLTLPDEVHLAKRRGFDDRRQTGFVTLGLGAASNVGARSK